jgi:hypothetical protein
VSLEQAQGAINRYAINLGIHFSRMPQNLAGVQMLLGGFYHTQNRATLARHTQSPRHQFGLQTAWDFSFG